MTRRRNPPSRPAGRPRGAPRTALLRGGLLVVVLACLAAPADAHPVLTGSRPADGATVEQPPAEVLLDFNETPDPALAVVHVADASGQPVEAGGAQAVPGRPTRLRVPLAGVARGSYTVTWRTTSSADGHTTGGSLAFGVGVPVAAVAGTQQATAGVPSETPTVPAVLGRWLFHAGVVLLLGAAVVGVAVVSNPTVVSPGLMGLAWTAAAAGLLLTVEDERRAAMTGLVDFLSSSTGGRLTTQALAVAMAGATIVVAWRRPHRWSLAAVGAAASAAMLARASAGHANASSTRWFTVGTQWVHLVAVGAWVGGLVWLLVAIGRGDPGRGRGLARRFSAVATVTLAVVALSGTLRAVDQVGPWGRLLDTRFGTALLVKLGLFAALVALGARNRLRHVHAASGGRVGNLRRLVRGEVAIAAGVLGAAAVLASLPPGASVAEAARSGTASGGSLTGGDAPGGGATTARCGEGGRDPSFSVVSLGSDPDPPRVGVSTLRLAVRQHGRPVTGAEVCVRADMPAHQHPGVLAFARETSPGEYATRLDLGMEGSWSGSVTISRPGTRTVVVPIDVEVR